MKKYLVLGLLSISLMMNACGSEVAKPTDDFIENEPTMDSALKDVETDDATEEKSSEPISDDSEETTENMTIDMDNSEEHEGGTLNTSYIRNLTLRTWEGEMLTEGTLDPPTGNANFSSESVKGSDLSGNGKYRVTSLEGDGFWIVSPLLDEISPDTAEAIYIIGSGTDDDEFNKEMKDASNGVEVEINDENVVAIYNTNRITSVKISFEALDVVDPNAEWDLKVTQAKENGPEIIEYPEDVKTETIIIDSYESATPMDIVWGKINDEEITWYCESDIGSLAGSVISQHGWVECKGTWGVSKEGHNILKNIEPLD